MEMTLYDLIDAYEFADIERTFKRLYKDQFTRNAVGYEEVFETLKDFEDVILSDMIIFIKSGEDGCATYVNGRNDKDDTHYSLSFTSWKEWLGMKVDGGSLENYSAKEIICHCLWEMTFYGYNEETINSFISEIEMSMADIMEEIDDIEEEAESSKILKDMLRNEIESSSSSEER